MQKFAVISALAAAALAGPIAWTPAQITDALHARDTPAVVTVSNCHWHADPHVSGQDGCTCDGYDGILPGNPSPGKCQWTTVSGKPSPPSVTPAPKPTQTAGQIGFPYTHTELNGEITAYATTTNMGEGPVPTGSSTIVKPGTTYSLAVEQSTKVNVNTLKGDELYTSIYDRLAKACPTPTADGTETRCDKPDSIENVGYVLNKDGNYFYNDGVVEFDFPAEADKYTTKQGRDVIITSIASALKSASEDSANTKDVVYNPPNAANPYGISSSYSATAHIVSIPSAVQVTFVDAGNDQPIQQALLNLSFEGQEAPEGTCDKVAMGLEAGSALLGIIPGIGEVLKQGVEDAVMAVGIVCKAVE